MVDPAIGFRNGEYVQSDCWIQNRNQSRGGQVQTGPESVSRRSRQHVTGFAKGAGLWQSRVEYVYDGKLCGRKIEPVKLSLSFVALVGAFALLGCAETQAAPPPPPLLIPAKGSHFEAAGRVFLHSG